ncbi:MAG: right-handed parallel beta-helix repeat-containing protein [Burkholderiaceae bacterium]
MQRLFILIVLAIIHISVFARAQSVLAVPSGVHDNQTVWLQCGQIYSGELKLIEARDVTIQTAGSCGKATLTPAVPVEGWQRDPYQPQIWNAPLASEPLQVRLDDEFITLAHYPNTIATWLKGQRKSPRHLRAHLPNEDLGGATIVWRAADWLIQSRLITRYASGVLTLAEGDDDGFGLLPETSFYLEGKRWMLDSPGEWAWHNGVLSIWPRDGKTPQGRLWASTGARAIDARGSQRVTIIGVRVVGAKIGIDGSGSRDLAVRDTDIINSAEDALLLGSDARVSGIVVNGSQQHGVRADDDAHTISISDSRFTGIGMLGMPRRSKGVLVFESARDLVIERNQISDAAYLGIRVFRDAHVTNNIIKRACLRLADCGGIYTFARDRKKLNTVIDGNRIIDLAGRSTYGIYLDDFANGVLVQNNHIENSGGGIELHNGFDNHIVANRFIGNRHEHILFNETAPFASISSNRIYGNQFSGSPQVPVYRLWSRHGSTTVRRFAEFSGNQYHNPPQPFAEVEGLGMLDFATWRVQIVDELKTSGNDSSRTPKLKR